MTDKPTPTDAVALARYKVVPARCAREGDRSPQAAELESTNSRRN